MRTMLDALEEYGVVEVRPIYPGDEVRADETLERHADHHGFHAAHAWRPVVEEGER